MAQALRASSRASSARVVNEQQRALVHLLGFVVVVGVCRDVAHLAVAKPSLHVVDQTFFGGQSQHVAKAGVVHFVGAGRFLLDLALEHLDTDLVHKFKVLDHPGHQRVLHLGRLLVEPVAVADDFQTVFQRCQCALQGAQV